MPLARIHRFAAAAPDDMSGIEQAIIAGSIDPAGIIAVFGKTEGNGLVNDFSRGFAVQSLRLLLEKPYYGRPSHLGMLRHVGRH